MRPAAVQWYETKTNTECLTRTKTNIGDGCSKCDEEETSRQGGMVGWNEMHETHMANEYQFANEMDKWYDPF